VDINVAYHIHIGIVQSPNVAHSCKTHCTDEKKKLRQQKLTLTEKPFTFTVEEEDIKRQYELEKDEPRKLVRR
jgi:hypothetical protein